MHTEDLPTAHLSIQTAFASLFNQSATGLIPSLSLSLSLTTHSALPYVFPCRHWRAASTRQFWLCLGRPTPIINHGGPLGVGMMGAWPMQGKGKGVLHAPCSACLHTRCLACLLAGWAAARRVPARLPVLSGRRKQSQTQAAGLLARWLTALASFLSFPCPTRLCLMCPACTEGPPCSVGCCPRINFSAPPPPMRLVCCKAHNCLAPHSALCTATPLPAFGTKHNFVLLCKMGSGHGRPRPPRRALVPCRAQHAPLGRGAASTNSRDLLHLAWEMRREPVGTAPFGPSASL